MSKVLRGCDSGTTGRSTQALGSTLHAAVTTKRSFRAADIAMRIYHACILENWKHSQARPATFTSRMVDGDRSAAGMT
ncbi:hypothetical protein [Enhygromyxa salina]|uniref:hypothetical protein n=1 Tax=Enhygromyxa salina TaxID=215803 RepID=UPI0015E6B97B|nr:hypothetical protein [Enhygromyxa salina]